MKIAIIGATGFIGSKILNEALQRGHLVTALVRHPEKLISRINLVPKICDAENSSEIVEHIQGQEAVISAYNPGWSDPEIYKRQVRGYKSIIEGIRKTGVKRLLVVGGAGSLEVMPGLRLFDTPEFPKEYKEGALAIAETLNILKEDKELEWSYVSPSVLIMPGKRTGKFRLGSDQVLFDDKLNSSISLEDYAMAMLDELENPKHIRKRFTVGY